MVSVQFGRRGGAPDDAGRGDPPARPTWAPSRRAYTSVCRPVCIGRRSKVAAAVLGLVGWPAIDVSLGPPCNPLSHHSATMITRQQIWRAFQTVAVPLLLALISRQIWPTRPEQTPESLYLPLLADIDFVPRTLPATYRKDSSDFDAYQYVSVLPDTTSTATPNVTAVILNWSRFPNIVLIASLLCGPWLKGTISEVFIWNNSPRHITYEVCISFQFPLFARQLTRNPQEMKNTGCPRSKLRIHNAPANLLFQARFMACAQASTPYCFIQVGLHCFSGSRMG